MMLWGIIYVESSQARIILITLQRTCKGNYVLITVCILCTENTNKKLNREENEMFLNICKKTVSF